MLEIIIGKTYVRGSLSVKHMLEGYDRLKHVRGLLSVKTLDDYYR